jgi:N utilization substance protein B
VPSRRKTREFVLQVLFAADTRRENPLDVLEFLEKHFESEQEDDLQMHRVLKDFSRDLIEAVSQNKEIIDQLITRLSHNWKLYRINRVDRNILRMAIAEMVTFPETPGRVILNEAIEIGKKYGAENSSAFINGILDRIHVLEPRPDSAEQLLEILMTLDQPSTTS